MSQAATKSRGRKPILALLLCTPISSLFALLAVPLLADAPPSASGQGQDYTQIELTTVEISAEGRRQLGIQSDAYPDALTDLQAAASARKVTLSEFTFPAFITPDGTPAYLHLPHNERLTANSSMTVGAGVRMTTHIMPDGKVLLGFALQTQRMEDENRVDTDRIDLERVLHDNQSRWIGKCRQANGSDRLTYVKAHRIYVQAGEAVPVKTQLLLLDLPSPFQSDDPKLDWEAARQTVRLTFMFINIDVKGLRTHPSASDFHNLRYTQSPPSLIATVEDGEDTVVSQSLPGVHSADRTGADIHVMSHLKANQSVQSTFSIKVYEPELKQPDSIGAAPDIIYAISTTRTLQSGGFAILGDYTTQDGINHEIDVQVETTPTERSVAASRYHSPPFRFTHSILCQPGAGAR